MTMFSSDNKGFIRIKVEEEIIFDPEIVVKKLTKGLLIYFINKNLNKRYLNGQLKIKILNQYSAYSRNTRNIMQEKYYILHK